MQQLQIKNLKKVRRAIPVIERKVKIKTSLTKDYVFIKGNEVNCFLVKKILLAVDFGFDIEDAFLLLKDDYSLEFINIKEHTRRKNLTEVRARVIGRQGKAMRTIEELTGGVVVVMGNVVGLIVDSEHLEPAVQGICSLIGGAKHSNVFSYLEKQNRELRKMDDGDLGLR